MSGLIQSGERADGQNSFPEEETILPQEFHSSCCCFWPAGLILTWHPMMAYTAPQTQAHLQACECCLARTEPQTPHAPSSFATGTQASDLDSNSYVHLQEILLQKWNHPPKGSRTFHGVVAFRISSSVRITLVGGSF